MSPNALRRLSDERLSSRLASGDAAAFDAIYERYAHRLAAYGAHLLGDDSAGEDVAQAALLNAYQALRSGRSPQRLRPWLYRIAHNAAIDLLARRRELLRGDPSEGFAADPHESSSLRGELVKALAELPERQRRVYVLRELHGLPVREIGSDLGLTQQQVEQALFSARSRLAELIVFGGRLRCDVARRLAQRDLHATERRALKGHLRTCASCRAAIGRRSAGVALLPLSGLDWLRGAIAALVGGGAPAVKVGVVVATAAVAAGAPLALHDEPGRRAPRARSSAPRTVSLSSHPAPVRRQQDASTPRGQAVVTSRAPDKKGEDRSADRRDGDRSRKPQERRRATTDTAREVRSPHRDEGPGPDSGPATAPDAGEPPSVVAPTATTTGGSSVDPVATSNEGPGSISSGSSGETSADGGSGGGGGSSSSGSDGSSSSGSDGSSSSGSGSGRDGG